MATLKEEVNRVMNCIVRSECYIKENNNGILLLDTPYGNLIKFEFIANENEEVEEVTLYCNDNYISTTKISKME